jgi:hypothetical protein
MRSFSCSTIVELFHLPSRVLIAMMVSSTVVVISNQWSSIHCMRSKSPRSNRPHDIEQESCFVGSHTRPQRAGEERLLRKFPRDNRPRRVERACLPFFCKGSDLLVILFGRVHDKRHADAPLRYGACRYKLTVRRFIGCHNPKPAIVRDRWRSLGVQRKQEQRRCEDETRPRILYH